MNNILTASILKITGRNRATTPLNGSIITNGGISCSNIYCEKDATISELTVKGITTTDILDVKDTIKVSGNILPHNNVMSSIGMESMRWDNIYCKNIDVIGNITLGDRGNSPIIEITDEVVCNSNINFLNNGKQFLEMKNGVMKLKGDMYINSIFKVIGNSRVDVKGDIHATTLNLNRFLVIEPGYQTIDKESYTLTITSSVMILNIRMDAKIDFTVAGDINNVLVKILFINYGSYIVTVVTDNKEFTTDRGFDLFVVNDDKVLAL